MAPRWSTRRTTATRATSYVSSARTTPGSTTSTARSGARRTPTSWSISTRPITSCCPLPSTRGRASYSSTLTPTRRIAGRLSGRPSRRGLRLPDRQPASSAADRVRGGCQLEGHRRELLRVLPLSRRPSPAQPAVALRPRSQPRVARAVGGRLDGARRRRRHDVRRRPRPWPPAAARNR